jgi:membrane-associated protease RseP (regulator of RpoE activity)
MLTSSGCAVRNIFTVYYRDNLHGKTLESCNMIPFQGRPRIFEVSRPIDKEKKLLENKYACQGFSVFNKYGNMDQLIVHAQKIRAENVVIATSVNPTGWRVQQGTGGTTYATETYASFWNKLKKPPRLGIYCNDLRDTDKKKAETNKGVVVTIVIKNTPAYNNDIVIGDIILKVNGDKVIDSDNFIEKIKKIKGSEVELEIFRKDRIITKVINLID